MTVDNKQDPASAGEILRSAPNILRRTRHGVMLYNEHDYYMAKSLSVLGEYSETEAAFLAANLRPGDTVIEAGANIGALTLPMAKAVGSQGKIIAFEAQRQMFQLLSANLALNGLDNVQAHHKAVGAQPGEIGIPAIDYHRSNNFGGVSLQTDSMTAETVPLTSIDLLPVIDHLRLVKADVEGMELDVLTGAEATLRRHRPLLYLENNLREKSPAILRWLLDRQYRVFWHLPPLWSAQNFYGASRDPFLSATGQSILSVNIIACPDHFRLDHFPHKEIHDPEDWWKAG